MGVEYIACAFCKLLKFNDEFVNRFTVDTRIGAWCRRIRAGASFCIIIVGRISADPSSIASKSPYRIMQLWQNLETRFIL